MSAWFPPATPSWRRYLRLVRADIHADTDEELRLHMESRIQELIQGGLSHDEASARALEEFGDYSTYRESLMAIDSRIETQRTRTETFRGILGDAAYAVRSLRRAPAMTFAILATLGLGVGANTAMFTLIDAIFLRPPAGVADAGRIQRVWAERHYSDGVHYSQVMGYAHFAAAVDAVGDRARLAIYRPPINARIGAGENAPTAGLAHASIGYFAFVGARAEVGRLFSPEEDALEAAAPVAVISHAYWQRAFGGESNVIGQTIVYGGSKRTIIGVVAAPFVGTDLDAAEIWVPLAPVAGGRTARAPWYRNPNVNGFAILLRRSPNVDAGEIEARLTAAFRRPGVGYASDTNSVAKLGALVAANGPGEQSQEVKIAVRLGAVAIIVLIIACSNVVNLLLARAVRRRQEIAVRLALGISRSRLIRMLVTESAVLAIGSAVVALTIAFVGGSLLRKLLLPTIHWGTPTIDWTTALFALAVALAAGVLAGLLPALRSASPELTNALKAGAATGASRPSRLRAVFVVVQAALSVVLLVGAALFVRSLANIRGARIGFDASELITANVTYDDRSRNADPTLPVRLAELAARVARLPGVERTALTTARPMYSITWVSYFTETDSLGSRHGWLPTITAVSPGYFAASGTRFIKGSDFPDVPPSSMPQSVIVNEEMAKGLWPGRDAIGQCIRFGTRTDPCYRVTAVVETAHQHLIVEDPQPQYYLPLGNMPPSVDKQFGNASVIVVRSRPGQATAMSTELRRLMRDAFPGAIPEVNRLGDYLEPQYRPWRLGATLFSLFGVLALVVAVIGIYSTVSYSVNQRVREFGIRMALGANVSNVLRLVVAEGLRTVALGVVVGIVLALATGRFVAALLYGVEPGDIGALSIVAATLLVVGAAAAFVPAWRASRVDPVTALRSE